MTTVAIGSASFGRADPRPLERLREAGITIRPNALGRTLDEDQTIALVADADGWLAGAERVSRRVMTSATHLRAVARIGVGLDTVDLAAAEALGIAVSRTPDAPTDAVAEATVGALLALMRGLIPTSGEMRAGRWTRHLGTSLRGAAILIVGYGRIGRRTAELLRAFGAEILVVDPAVDRASLIHGERLVSLDEGLAIARVVSLHAPGGTTLLDRDALARMRPDAWLLNSARGDLVDEDALADALAGDRLAGCWLDVFREEPYAGPLLASPKVLATPHAATFTHECRLRMEMEAVENLLRDLARTPAR